MKKYGCTGIDEPYRNNDWCPDGSNPGCRNKKEYIPRAHTFWPVKKEFQKDIVKDEKNITASNNTWIILFLIFIKFILIFQFFTG